MLKKLFVVPVIIVVLVLLPSWRHKKTPNNTSLSHLQMEHWVDSVYTSLSYEEQIGQLFMIAAYSNKDAEHKKEIEEAITKYHIGGLIFMQGGPVRQAHLLNHYQSLAKVPLMISMDAEWGLAMRLDSTVHFPKQMTLGAIQDNNYIYRMGEEIALHCKRIGMQVNFAPVVDVNVNRNNPVIGMRSFGEDKENVAEKGIAYMKGMQSQHVLANAKHFPGHGDTDVDSHLDLPVINHSVERLNEIELYPFKRLIADSLASMMVAHLYIPSLDNTPNTATTLSPKVVEKLLKKDLKFEGLVFTDALNMKGISKFFSPGEADLKALLAGNDVLLFSKNVPGAVELIKGAIAKKDFSKEELEHRVKKILRAKYWSGLNEYKPIEIKNIYNDLNNSMANAIRETLYEKAMTVVKNENGLLPIEIIDTNSFASISIGLGKGNNFQQTLSKYAAFDHYSLGLQKATQADYNYVTSKTKTKKVVVVGLHSLNNTSSENFKINDQTVAFIKQLSAQTNVIIVVFGNPYSLRNFEFSKQLICTYEENYTTRKLAPQLIFGAFGADGKLPVSPSTTLKVGTGVKTKNLKRMGFVEPGRKGIDVGTLNRIDSIMKVAINDSATPGGQVLVARDGAVVYEKGFGNFTYEKKKSVNDFTLYDIASVTKVAATLQAVAFLTQNGELNLDTAITTYLPDLKGTNKAYITIREILTHQAGLFPFIAFWRNTLDSEHEEELSHYYYSENQTPHFNIPVTQNLFTTTFMEDSVWNWIKAYKQIDPNPKTGVYPYKYSDLGYYILKRIIEQKTQQPINEFLEQNFYLPLGMHYTTYLPLEKFPIDSITPTENDLSFRNTQVQGTVHDQGAAMLGGVAGHAGLFSTAFDLAKLLQLNLNGGTYGGQKYFSESVVKEFTAAQFTENRRGLGWDKSEVCGLGPTGEYASPACFGHSGFTGTGVWVDPDYDLIYVFLSNRIYPDAENRKLLTTDVRTKIHDVIYMSIMNFNDDFIN